MHESLDKSLPNDDDDAAYNFDMEDISSHNSSDSDMEKFDKEDLSEFCEFECAVANPIVLVKTGHGPNIARNIIINAAELASYDQVKQTILKIPGFTDNVVTHLLASLWGRVKSRMLGDSSYKSTLACFIKTLKNDGPFAFYKGFLPNFGRLGSWNVIVFQTLEQTKKFVKSLESS
ncbi:mitochondrial uncoupling protein 1 [Cajanus cajan]|uniref:mitochondrial uncoupling protein 1 n=1 Tax=Cajanus cajan TaxID=3821 RepID=UPI0010FAF837|nr:mitochondrial uncoupling protein 1 [Cajanus cajan]